MSKDDLKSILTEAALMSYAGGRSFAAGQSYFGAHCVKNIEVTDGVINARVAGSQMYKVRLWAEDDGLNSFCSCPFAADGNFCKHMVVAGLAWLAGQYVEPENQRSTLSSIREYLNGLDKSEVVQLLMASLNENDALYNQLALSAAQSSASGPSPAGACL